MKTKLKRNYSFWIFLNQLKNECKVITVFVGTEEGLCSHIHVRTCHVSSHCHHLLTSQDAANSPPGAGRRGCPRDLECLMWTTYKLMVTTMNETSKKNTMKMFFEKTQKSLQMLYAQWFNCLVIIKVIKNQHYII